MMGKRKFVISESRNPGVLKNVFLKSSAKNKINLIISSEIDRIFKFI